jgi:hypothetical protein
VRSPFGAPLRTGLIARNRAARRYSRRVHSRRARLLAAVVVVAASAAMALVALGASAGPLLHTVHQTVGQLPTRSRVPETTRARPVPRMLHPGSGHAPSLLLTVVLVAALFAVALVLALVAGAVVYYGRGGLLLGRAPAPALDSRDLDADAAGLRAAALRARAALDGEDPRSAVIRCWVTLQDAAAASGIARTASETSAELATRVLGGFAVDALALDLLQRQYNRARFSEAPVTERDRSAARAAADRIVAGLVAPAERAEQVPADV